MKAWNVEERGFEFEIKSSEWLSKVTWLPTGLGNETKYMVSSLQASNNQESSLSVWHALKSNL